MEYFLEICNPIKYYLFQLPLKMGSVDDAYLTKSIRKLEVTIIQILVTCSSTQVNKINERLFYTIAPF